MARKTENIGATSDRSSFPASLSAKARLRNSIRMVLGLARSCQDHIQPRCRPAGRRPAVRSGNHVACITQIDKRLKQVQGTPETLALLRIGVDGMRATNEALGYEIGDKLLHQVAQRVSSTVGAIGFAAHWEGDEFVALLPAAKAFRIAQSLLQQMRLPFLVAGSAIHVSASIGAAWCGDEDGRSLLRQAGLALHRAKELGRNRYCSYDPLHDTSMSDLPPTPDVGEMRQALLAGEFMLLYQPKIDLAFGEVVGAEALLRWNHPQHGLISPDRFIAAAESAGMICEIGEWVIRQACEQLRLWRDLGHGAWDVSVNVSVFQLTSPSFVAIVRSALVENGVNPRRLILEVTESGAMRHLDVIQSTLRMLDEMGVRVSLDDFGIEFSSLARLRRLPVSELKIDRAFVRCIESDETDMSIVRAIVSLGHAVGVRVVAEGVENSAQQELLESLGCDLVQGYLHSEPLSEEQFQRFTALSTARQRCIPQQDSHACHALPSFRPQPDSCASSR